jgi:hypothetical protein
VCVSIHGLLLCACVQIHALQVVLGGDARGFPWLFTSRERDMVGQFLALPTPAQGLYARLLNRKGVCMRAWAWGGGVVKPSGHTALPWLRNGRCMVDVWSMNGRCLGYPAPPPPPPPHTHTPGTATNADLHAAGPWFRTSDFAKYARELVGYRPKATRGGQENGPGDDDANAGATPATAAAAVSATHTLLDAGLLVPLPASTTVDNVASVLQAVTLCLRAPELRHVAAVISPAATASSALGTSGALSSGRSFTAPIHRPASASTGDGARPVGAFTTGESPAGSLPRCTALCIGWVGGYVGVRLCPLPMPLVHVPALVLVGVGVRVAVRWWIRLLRRLESSLLHPRS